jgi:hypothetical protein
MLVGAYTCIIVVLMCLDQNLAVIILSLIGVHSSSILAASFIMMMAMPLLKTRLSENMDSRVRERTTMNAFPLCVLTN